MNTKNALMPMFRGTIPSHCSLAPDSVHVWVHFVGDTEQSALAILSQREIEHAMRFAGEHDRRTYLATRVMVRRLLSLYADVAPREWCFETNAYGRPEIAPLLVDQPLYFNLSHTVTTVVCAIARFPDIGIDVECLVPEEFDSIAENLFCPHEVAWLQEAEGHVEARRRFLQLWTLKEAYIKARGTGLSTALNSFSLIPEGDHSARFADREPGEETASWFFQHWPLENSCELAMAARVGCGSMPRLVLHEYP
jgi:4'-phosphopantetheinyl transferase